MYQKKEMIFMGRKTAVLLTGTINSTLYGNTGNRICDIKERERQYLHAIRRYILESVFNVIVFAENSGYPFDTEEFVSLAKSQGKEFEYVSCPSYVEETSKRGKSYGEARLIQDALERSRLLQDVETIYKVTGRIFLINSYQICKTRDEHQFEFIVYMCKKWCFTNIFKFNKTGYQKLWWNISEKCDEKKGKDIERMFYQILEENPQLDVGSFCEFPYFDGIQGATLDPYSGSRVERIARNMLSRLGTFTYGTWIAKHLKF